MKIDKKFNFKLTQKLYDDSIIDTIFDNYELIKEVAELLIQNPKKAIELFKADFSTYEQKMLEDYDMHECGNEIKQSNEYYGLYYCAECGTYFDDKNNEVEHPDEYYD